MIKFLDLHKQYQSIKLEIDEAIQSVIADSAFIGGQRVKDFEAEFAKFQQADFCVGVANGTDALEIALEALDLPEDAEVIVPANSFIASSEAVTRTGHRVVFCDCHADNYTIDIESLTSVITEKTAAIMVVHLYGHPCDMQAIMAIAEEHDLKVIEDCAQAHGAEFKDHRVGALGHIGTFSFYPGKNLGAYGDAGAIVTNDETLASHCRMIANHGRLAKYNHEFEGRNSRLDGLQAAILSVKLRHLELWTQRRIAVADRYLDALASVSAITLPQRESWARQVYHLFVIRTDKRDELQQFLKDNDVQVGIHYPISLPKLPAYEYMGLATKDWVANQQDQQLLSLPIGEHISDTDVDRVVELISSFFEGKD